MNRQLSRFVLLVLALLLAAPQARAGSRSNKEDPAKAKLEEGMKLFGEKRYEEAIVVLRQGYALSNKPEFLYALGQVERLRGNCQIAVVMYRSFLDSKPPTAQAEAAQLQIERCQKLLKQEAKPDSAQAKPEVKPAEPTEPAKTETKPAEAKVETKPDAKPADAKPDLSAKPAPEPAGGLTSANPSEPAGVTATHKPWYRDTVGDVLLGAGAATLGGGGVLFAVGHSAASGAGDNPNNYASAKSSTWEQPAGAALMGGGVALIAGSVVRYVLVGRSGSSGPSSAPPQESSAPVAANSTPR